MYMGMGNNLFVLAYLSTLILTVYSGNQFSVPETNHFFSTEARLASVLLDGYNKQVSVCYQMYDINAVS